MIALWHKLPANFEEQLAAVVGMASAYHFDDGYADVLRAADGLDAHGLRGVFFIISGRVGRNGYATSAQLREVLARGHELGNHTRTHPFMPNLSSGRQRLEIAGAQTALADLFGRRPRRFAWPHGAHDRVGDRVAARFGFVERRDISNVVRNVARLTVAQLVELFECG